MWWDEDELGEMTETETVAYVKIRTRQYNGELEENRGEKLLKMIL
jgi:hypothetical protein